MMELKLASRSQVAMVYGRDLKPSFTMPEKCTKTSFPPSATMNP